jgi:hypothetical protein
MSESQSVIVCLQKTKRYSFDVAYLKQFYPRRLCAFEFSPSIGTSEGLITIWNSNLFDGVLVSSNGYSVIVQLTSKQSGMPFHVTNIYDPLASAEKVAFISWLYNFDTSTIDDWIILGDFNLLRYPSNRNRPGGTLIQ